MRFNPSATELTTAVTDAILALLCLALLISLARLPARARWKKVVWGSIFVLLAIGSALGAVAHGFDLSRSVRATMWQPLYLSLGLSVALFLVGSIGDWLGEHAARATFPWAIGVGAGFFVFTQLSDGGFGVFLAYEGVAMIASLVIYASLWMRRRLAGAGTVALGILLTLAAAAIQASTLSVRFVWPFDHNGLFHLVQIVAFIVIATGVRAGLTGQNRPFDLTQ